VLRDLLISMRPKQWSKNVFVFAGIVFSRELFALPALGKALLAFFLFCMVSSATYLLNDVRDIARDRAHPIKRNRPLASGRLRPAVAIAAALLLVAISFPIGFILNLPLGVVLVIYFALMQAYTFRLKEVVILDVFTLAAGFVLRVVGGAVAISVMISEWLFICMLLLSLFLALAKRRHELLLLSDGAGSHRPILAEYSPALLEEMLSIITASTVMAYSLYTFFATNLQDLGYPFPYMMLTIPFVIYAIFRYLYLVYQKNGGGSPEEVLLRDIPFLVNLLLWGGAVVTILYLLPHLYK
jgi:4-hydroxybenzoate polyprenyltransferase